jgi:hypothetical protein
MQTCNNNNMKSINKMKKQKNSENIYLASVEKWLFIVFLD